MPLVDLDAIGVRAALRRGVPDPLYADGVRLSADVADGEARTLPYEGARPTRRSRA